MTNIFYIHIHESWLYIEQSYRLDDVFNNIMLAIRIYVLIITANKISPNYETTEIRLTWGVLPHDSIIYLKLKLSG